MGDLYKTDGTENLRANPTVKSAGQNDSPAGKGTDAGGTENRKESTTVKTGSHNESPTGSADKHPSGVQSFTDSSV
jgi:hypothetical protein